MTSWARRFRRAPRLDELDLDNVEDLEVMQSGSRDASDPPARRQSLNWRTLGGGIPHRPDEPWPRREPPPPRPPVHWLLDRSVNPPRSIEIEHTGADCLVCRRIKEGEPE